MGNVAVKIDQVERKGGSWTKASEHSVLIIDEANRTRAQIAQILRQKGLEKSYEAESGTEAMKFLAAALQSKDGLPDLIIYNVSYSLDDRIEFCVKLRELGSAEFKRLPIIFLSSTEDERLDLLVEHIGNALAVVRPVSPEKLAKYIDYLVSKSRE